MGWESKKPLRKAHVCRMPDPNTVDVGSIWVCGGFRGCGTRYIVMPANDGVSHTFCEAPR